MKYGLPIIIARMTRGLALCAAMLLPPAWLDAAPPSMADAARESARANGLVQAGKAEQAIPIYRKLTAAFPAEPSFQVNLSIALYKSARYRETIAECNALLQRQPDLFPAWLFLGASHLKLGAAADAETALRKAVALQPNDANARLMLADALLAKGRWADAAEQYLASAQAIPDSPRVWSGLGHSYSALADENFSRLQSAAPGSAEDLALAAEFEVDSGQLMRAFQNCRQALALQPLFRGLHDLIAEIYEASGHPAWAQAERAKTQHDVESCTGRSSECDFAAGRFREAAAVQTSSPDALYWRTKALLSLSKQAYGRLKTLAPSRESFEAAAAAEEKRGRYPEAAAAWKEALRLEPSDSQLQRQLALALCHANDCASALPVLKGLLGSTPDFAELNYLFGLALNSTQNPKEALPYLEKAVRLDGAFLPARAALGEAYLECGRAELAIPQLKAAAVDDENGSRHYQLAQAYQAVGKRAEAVIAVREYRELVARRAAEQQTEPLITPP